MKITSFTATNVYGYMKFDFSFHSNPTILVGPNGSGKTTALRMMQALLTPSLRDLLTISFTEATISLSDGSRIILISAKKTKEKLYLFTSSEVAPLEVPVGILDQIEIEYSYSKRHIESSRLLRAKYSDNPTFKFISQLESPLFLGLERRQYGFQDESPSHQSSGWIVHNEAVHGTSLKKSIKGSLGAGLQEVQDLVRFAYSRVRKLKDQQSARLRRKLLLTGFRYEEVSRPLTFDTSEFSVSGDELIKQRDELMRALGDIGIDYADARKEIWPFFERVIKLSERLGNNWVPRDADLGLEVILNQANLRRLRELVETVREFNQKSEQLLNRFQSFIDCINRFFSDSRKTIDIDPVGTIKVYRPDKTEVPVEALSSGERQLLVMFGHIFFNSFGRKSNAFVIDEPEISLHLRWQEILLEEMMESSSRAQLIIATHSPEIVGDLTGNCVGV